jgi:hypothetical protein
MASLKQMLMLLTNSSLEISGRHNSGSSNGFSQVVSSNQPSPHPEAQISEEQLVHAMISLELSNLVLGS